MGGDHHFITEIGEEFPTPPSERGVENIGGNSIFQRGKSFLPTPHI